MNTENFACNQISLSLKKVNLRKKIFFAIFHIFLAIAPPVNLRQ